MREEVQTERVCSAFDAKKRAGEFNVKNAPFGYKLSGDKNKPYLIDEPAAKIVREIFALKKAGESIHGIMRMMDEKYPMPRQYLYEQGLVKKVKENPHWNMSAVSHRQTIREKLLKSVVLTFIKAQVKLADELEVRVESINENALRMKKAVSLRNETVALQERIEKLEFYLRSSFESHISGVLNESDYLFNKSKYVTEILSCKNRMESLAGIVLPIDVEEVKLNPYVTSMRKFSKARALTREMCVALIEKIEVDKDNVVTIFPKYRDEFSALCERIEKEESEMKQNE